MSTNRTEYIKKYMMEYRKGIRRKERNDAIRKQIKLDRLSGDDIYTIGLRYNYRPESVARLCKELPIKKHANRGKYPRKNEY